jgi:outer membrane protein TolC
MSVEQTIWQTGGKLSLTSSLDYYKQLGTSKSEQFMSVPVGLTLSQPIFNVNKTKWQRKIEPVRYAEAKASFIASTEKVTMKAITYYFDLLLAKENLNIARQNLSNADHLYEVAVAKRQMGQISENEVLQLKLAALKAKGSVTEMQSNLNAKMFQLSSFLGLSEQEQIDPEIPESVSGIQIDYQTVLRKAQENNSFAQNIRRRQLEADYEVASAKGSLRNINFYASVGYTGLANEINPAYNNLMGNKIVEVGVKLPILDWGKGRGNVKVAESNSKVVALKIEQERMTFNQDIFLLVEQFNNQAMQLNIAKEADDIAQKRYQTSIETFLIGKINTLDLNDAQVNKDEAKQKHITELYKYWYYYYQIRSLTLYDFQNDTNLSTDFESIINN